MSYGVSEINEPFAQMNKKYKHMLLILSCCMILSCSDVSTDNVVVEKNPDEQHYDWVNDEILMQLSELRKELVGIKVSVEKLNEKIAVNGVNVAGRSDRPSVPPPVRLRVSNSPAMGRDDQKWRLLSLLTISVHFAQDMQILYFMKSRRIMSIAGRFVT